MQVDHVRQAFGDSYYRATSPTCARRWTSNHAWRRSSGRGVKVAVVDTGVDPHHEDLPRLLRGRDFVSGDRNASDGQSGTGPSSPASIAAQRDNGRGIAGVSRASILPVRVLNSRGSAATRHRPRHPLGGEARSADIINLSLGRQPQRAAS